MISIILILLISFILEGMISSLFSPFGNIFIPLFSIISLVIIYPFFNNNNSNFLKTSFIIGVFYDLVYTDTLILNAFVFLVVGYLIKYINKRLTNNVFNVIIMSVFSVVSYRVLTYVVLVFVDYLKWDFNRLLESIYSSLILNIIYGVLMYLVADYFSRKYRIQKID